jgi:hypothetical protein
MSDMYNYVSSTNVTDPMFGYFSESVKNFFVFVPIDTPIPMKPSGQNESRETSVVTGVKTELLVIILFDIVVGDYPV